MKSLVHALVGALVILALALVPPVLAQDRGGQAAGGGAGGDRGGGGGGAGTHTGGGNAGGGGTSSGSSSSSSGGGFSGGSSGGGFSSGGSSGGGFSGGSISSPNYNGPSPLAGARGAGGARMGGAMGREGMAMTRGGEGRMAVAADPSNSSVPSGARPNYGGSPAVGSAVPRGTVARPGYDYTPNGRYDQWNPWGYYGGDYYYGSAFYGYGYGYRNSCGGYGYPFGGGYNCYYPYDPFYLYGYGAFGLGSFYYDPSWFGFGAFGSGGGGGYSSGYQSSASDRGGQPSGPRGGLKLKVSPADAEVYVDGYYIGRVDDYNGVFQRLDLPVGAHRVELRAKGYQAINFEVTIEPRDTISYHGEMQRAQPIK